MPQIETEAIILKTYDLAEADRIIVFLTRDHGVARGVARGVKRMKSRFGSTLEPFTVVEISYFHKEDRELVSIGNVELVRSYFGSAVDPSFLQAFSYIADVLLRFTPPNDPSETLYRMLKACLAAAAQPLADLRAIRLYFELWLLRLGGFLPDWRYCGSCKTPFAAAADAFLRSGFHLHCARCSRSGIMQIDPAHRDLYARIQAMTPADFAAYGSERPETVEQLSAVLKRFIDQVIGSDVSIRRSAELVQVDAK